MRSVPALTEPSVASMSPDASRSMVVLPQPEGPTTATNSPGAMLSEIPASAAVPSAYRLPTSVNERTADAAVSATSCPVTGAVIEPHRLGPFHSKRTRTTTHMMLHAAEPARYGR